MKRKKHDEEIFCVLVLVMVGVLDIASGYAWNLPLDRATMGQEEINEILAGQDYPETTTYTKRIEFLDFASYGKKFTQVVIRLDPQKPCPRNGRKPVVVGGEPGSEYAIDFLKIWRERKA